MDEIFIYAWRVFSKNTKYIVLITVPFVVLMLPRYYLLEPLPHANIYRTIVGFGLYFFGFAAFISALVFFLGQEYQQDLQPVKSNIINGIFYAPLLMTAIFISYLPMIFVVLFVVNMKSLLVIAPLLVIFSLFFYFRTLLAPFHLILEGCNPLEAVLRSFKATQGQVTKIFIIVFFYIIGVVMVESGVVIRNMERGGNSFLFLCGVTVTMLMVAFQQIVFFRLYLNSFQSKDNQGKKPTSYF
jgi:hypothetical protein